MRERDADNWRRSGTTDTAVDPDAEVTARQAELTAFVGKRILVGMTMFDPAGEILGQEQASATSSGRTP